MNTPYYDVGTLEEEIASDYPVYSWDYVDQRTATATPVARTRTLSYLSVRTETVPQSFFDSLADFEAGRVVDIEIALNEPPPGV